MELLTVDETARMLKVSTITVRRYIEAGRLPAVRIGRGVRVRLEAIDQLIAPIELGRQKQRRPARSGKAFTYDDPLWNFVGSAGSHDGPTDVSENVDRYLADAYDPPQRG